MAALALTAAAVAGRRVASQTRPPLLASCRSGASRNHSASAQREEDHKDDAHGTEAAMTTGEPVEAALNSKNVEVLQGEEHVATVLPDETIDVGGAGAGEEASWVPDQETGVFGPADADTAATHGPPGYADADTAATQGPPGYAAAMTAEGGSVLDQTVFVREEEMEDVERPAIDMANANDNDRGNSNN